MKLKNKKLQSRLYLLVSLFAFLYLALFFMMLQLLQNKEGFQFLSVLGQTLVSLPSLLLLAFIDLQLIKWLNKKLYFKNKFMQRLFVELLMGAMLSIAMVLLANVLISGKVVLQNYFSKFLFNVPSIAAIFINSLIIFQLEFFIQYDRQKHKELEVHKLQSLNAEYMYNQLRSQINPHFLFNSLNVLTALIHRNADDATRFTKKLSNIYRYVLNYDQTDKISIQQELNFAKNYIDILKVRFGNHLHFSVHISEEFAQRQIPPMSLQLLIENAAKHNIISANNNLFIKLYQQNHYLCVENNINSLSTNSLDNHSGIGLKNLNSRLQLVANATIQIQNNAHNFIVKIPTL